MTRYLVFLALLTLGQNAFAEISTKPAWADIDKCPSMEHQLASSGSTKGLKAEEKARDLCATEAKAYQDKINCQVACQGLAFGKTCQWNLYGIKKSTKIDFEISNKKKILINENVWQPEYNLYENLFQLENHSVIIPPNGSEKLASILSPDLSNKIYLPKEFSTEQNVIPSKDGFFFIPEEVYYHAESVKIYFTNNLNSPPQNILTIPINKNHGYYNYHSYSFRHNVSYNQNIAAIQICDGGLQNASAPSSTMLCDAYLVDANGIIFKKSYTINRYDPHAVAVGADQSIWIYSTDEIDVLTKDSETKISYNIEFPSGPSNMQPYRVFAVPENNKSEKFQTFFYNGALVGVKDLYLLDSSGFLVESYPLRSDCSGSGWIDRKELFVNFDLEGKPQSISSDYYYEHCKNYGSSNYKFYKNGKLLKSVDLVGVNYAPLIHRQNEMELALTAKYSNQNYNDSRPGTVNLTLFDSTGNQYKTLPLPLPTNRVRTSSLISLGNDQADEMGADFAVTYGIPKRYNKDDRYGDAFIESFRIDRQCLDYQFRKH
jgi:hypothetical protein